MQSISKTSVSQSTAQQVVRSVFGAQAHIRSFWELTEGYFNAAYAIALDDGRTCVLKVVPPDSIRVLRYEQQIMSAEVAVMQLVKQSTTMPVPAIDAFDALRRILDSPFFLMEFVAGVPFHKLRTTLASVEQQTTDRGVGASLRQMNDISGPSFGYAAPSAPHYSSWVEAFCQMLDDVLADGAALDVPLPMPYGVVRQRLIEHSDVLAHVTTPQLVHWDLWDGNIFIDPATRQITGVIDFERAVGRPADGVPVSDARGCAGLRRWLRATDAGDTARTEAPGALQHLPLSDHGHRVHLPAVSDAGSGALGASSLRESSIAWSPLALLARRSDPVHCV